MLRAAKGGVHGASRGSQLDRAARRTAQGRPTPSSRLWWARGEVPSEKVGATFDQLSCRFARFARAELSSCATARRAPADRLASSRRSEREVGQQARPNPSST
jgi:hypothetical protein